MRNLLIAASLAMAAVLPTSSSAQSAPADVQTVEVTFGKLVGSNQVPMTYNGKTIMVQLDYCQVGWNTGDTFYIYHKDGAPYITVRKETMDAAVKAANNNWQVALKAMLDMKQVCAIAPVKAEDDKSVS